HHRELALVVELVGHPRHVDVVAGADHAADLLVEEHRNLRGLHAALSDVVAVVERDREVLARPRRAEQAHGVEGVLGTALYLDHRALFDPALGDAAVGLEAADPHWSLPANVRAAASRSFGRSRATRVEPSTIPRPPFFSFTLAPVRRPISPEKSG